MSIGIRMHDLPEGTLRQRANFAREQGFGCVQLALSKTVSPTLMEPSAATPGLAAWLSGELGALSVAVLGCYLNLAHPDEDEARRIQKRYIAQLQLARWLGAGVVGTETGNPNAAYRFDPEHSHGEEALALFITRLEPVVIAAEKLGAYIAIEPVWSHIVCDATRARRVLDAFASPNLRVILDPVNLLHAGNVARCDEVIAQAAELLGEETAVLHLKDYTLAPNGEPRSVAVGEGVMDYCAIMRFAATRKPHIQMLLEDTTPANAVYARMRTEEALSAAQGEGGESHGI